MSGRPTVGRIVLYWPDRYVDAAWLKPSPPGPVENPRLAGIISSVISGDHGDLVTLTVFQAAAEPVAVNRYLIEGDGIGMWSWPPRT